MPVVLSGLAATALALLFAWAGFAKLARSAQWRRALGSYRLPANTVLAPAVPVVEAVVPVLVLSGRSRAAAALALGLLSVFSLALLRARTLEGDKLPCGCFGRTTERDFRALLGRNAGIGLLAGIVLAAGRDVRALEDLGAPDASEWVPAILTVLGVVALGALALMLSSMLRGGRR